jgi:hypothetical protein
MFQALKMGVTKDQQNMEHASLVEWLAYNTTYVHTSKGLLRGLLVGVLGPTAHPGLPLKVFLGVGRCQRL